MATNTLLCIHRDPAQLSLLQEHGYNLVTATNAHDGLRLFMSRPADAIVLEYHLGLLDGTVIAAEIKQVKPQIPIVMLTENMDLPGDALTSVDALVAKSDGPNFLLATVHFVLNVKPALHRQEKLRSHALPQEKLPGISQEPSNHERAPNSQSAVNPNDAPFPPKIWRSIRNGSVRF